MDTALVHDLYIVGRFRSPDQGLNTDRQQLSS